MQTKAGLVLMLTLAVGALAGCDKKQTTPVPESVVVYRNPNCGCCTKWAQHLRDNGFTVTVRNETAMDRMKTELGVPDNLAACHTATIAGYVIEGHVPADDIRRLLTEKPPAQGLAVPDMPIGSPGMEDGERREPYEVLLFGKDAEPVVFARHGETASSP